MKCSDPIVEKNRELLLQRSELGIKKYGTTLQDSSAGLREFLNHALLESLDFANYIQSALDRLDRLERRFHENRRTLRKNTRTKRGN